MERATKFMLSLQRAALHITVVAKIADPQAPSGIFFCYSDINTWTALSEDRAVLREKKIGPDIFTEFGPEWPTFTTSA